VVDHLTKLIDFFVLLEFALIHHCRNCVLDNIIFEGVALCSLVDVY
jgi:hypothetical protein